MSINLGRLAALRLFAQQKQKQLPEITTDNLARIPGFREPLGAG